MLTCTLQTRAGNSVRLLGAKRANGRRLAGARLDLPKVRKNALIEILAINTGCLNSCTYCKTKAARGNLASYTIEELINRARQCYLGAQMQETNIQHLPAEGVREIWLTSEDLGAYGRDIGVTLPDLLQQLIEVIPEACMMRLGMTNPPYIMDHLPVRYAFHDNTRICLQEIADILNHPRVYAFLHIPVQSGSDCVLREMKREYTSAQFCQVVDYLQERYDILPCTSCKKALQCAEFAHRH